MDRMQRIRIPIVDLGCGGAGAFDIERRLGATDGVLRVYVNPATETAYVDFDPEQTNKAALGRVIERLGYKPGRPVDP